MLFEVGSRQPTNVELCRGVECERMEQPIEPGRVYELVYRLDPPVSEEALDRLADLYAEVQRRLPGITVVYVGISDDGRRVIFQVADPEPVALAPWGTIALIVVAIAIALTAYFLSTAQIETVRFFEEVFEKVPQLPQWAGHAIALAIAGVGIVLAGIGISKVLGAVGTLFARRR